MVLALADIGYLRVQENVYNAGLDDDRCGRIRIVMSWIRRFTTAMFSGDPLDLVPSPRAAVEQYLPTLGRTRLDAVDVALNAADLHDLVWKQISPDLLRQVMEIVQGQKQGDIDPAFFAPASDGMSNTTRSKTPESAARAIIVTWTTRAEVLRDIKESRASYVEMAETFNTHKSPWTPELKHDFLSDKYQVMLCDDCPRCIAGAGRPLSEIPNLPDSKGGPVRPLRSFLPKGLPPYHLGCACSLFPG